MIIMLFQENWHNGVMNLQLLDGGSWAAVSEGATVPLKITSIDTGAGQVYFSGGAICGLSVARAGAGLYRVQRFVFAPRLVCELSTLLGSPLVCAVLLCSALLYVIYDVVAMNCKK